MAVEVIAAQGLEPDLDAGAKLAGRLFMDGSAVPHRLKDCWMASWAVMLPGPRAHGAVVLRGTVPRELLQTAPVAEACAVTAFLEHAAAGAEGFTDCKTVLDLHGLPWWKRLSPKRHLAGFARQ
eukprot:10011047-Lingulodinium_polyedra.AAC.1